MALDKEMIDELNTAVEETTKPVEEAVDSTPLTAETVVDTSSADVKTEVADDTGGKPIEGEAKATTGNVELEKIVQPPVNAFVFARAIRAGMSVADAKSFNDDESLTRVTESLEAASKPVEKKKEQETDANVKLFDEIPDLDPEKYEADVVNMYAGLKNIIRKQQDAIIEIRETQRRNTEQGRRATESNTEKWFDERVAALGEDFHETLGKGGYKTLSPMSSQYQKRDAIANKTAILVAGYRASGQQVPPRDEVFAEAASLVLKGEYQKASEKKLSADLAKRSTQHIARVGGQSSKSKESPQDAIAQMLDERYFAKT